MHLALRTVLGTHVEQKGSLVNANNLRFDFSHFSKVTAEELTLVENFVNHNIAAQLPLIERRNIPFKQAVAEGAMALFGEKYGESVRAIKFGDSVELCGGIHVSNTSEIWQFKIVSESAVAAGIRRIEAITSEAVKLYYADQEKTIDEVKLALKNPQDILKAVSNLQDENAKLKLQFEVLMAEKVKTLSQTLTAELRPVGGIEFLAKKVDLSIESTKDLAYQMGQNHQNMFLIFATINDDKPMLSCYISKELVASKNLNASTVVRELGKYIQGGGGGQPFFATAGGKNIGGIDEALEKAITFLT